MRSGAALTERSSEFVAGDAGKGESFGPGEGPALLGAGLGLIVAMILALVLAGRRHAASAARLDAIGAALARMRDGNG
jgi:hypothetical protein